MYPEEVAAALCRFRRFSHDVGDVSKARSTEGVPQVGHCCLMRRTELGGVFWFGFI